MIKGFLSKAKQTQVTEGSNQGCGARAIEPSTKGRCSHRYAGPKHTPTSDRSGHFAAGGRHRFYPWRTYPASNYQITRRRR